jgi:cation:H+ antiporter
VVKGDRALDRSSLLAIALLVAGVILVVRGVDTFFDGLLAVAERFRISPFVVTIVLSGFEVENLAAGVAANAHGLSGAAAGTFLGGTTFLALAVAGLGALVAPIHTGLSRPALIWTAAAPLPLLLLGLDGQLSRRDGALLVAWFAIAIVGLARSGGPASGEDEDDHPPRFPLLRLLLGIALLTVGGQLLGDGLRAVVSRIGLSQTLLGNTALAAAVEAEEVARVVAPARRGRGELGLGNVAGTVVHFAAFNAGLIALVRPLPLDDATRHLHLPVAALAPALLVLLLAARGRLGRTEGAILVGLYVAYVAGAIALSR